MPKTHQIDENTAPSEVTEQIGQIATQETAQSTPLASSDEKNKDTKTEEPIVAGYGLGDLAKAPLTPPEQKQKETKRDTSNSAVKLLVFIGALVTLVGLILIFFITSLAIVLMAVGAACVAIAVFAPIRSRKSHRAKTA